MSISWTTQHVAALAPDAASLKAGEKLGLPTKWQTLGRADSLLWGEIKGSGKNPYQTSIALEEPAFKCSCPSRKFPCKHGIALALVFAASPTTFTPGEPLAWVQEWLDKRGARAQKQADKVAAQEVPVDPETRKKREAAQQKRSAAREDKVDAGVAELQRWLFDLIRQGLGQSEQAPWAHIATRMVDAQAPGLARRLQKIDTLRYRVTAWQEATLREMSLLHLLLQAWQRRTTLPDAVQADIQTQMGWPLAKENVLQQDGIPDQWAVIGQAHEHDGQMHTQRTWVYGHTTQAYALLLDFAVQNQAMTLYPAVGSSLPAELVYYPSALPQRALFKSEQLPTPVADDGQIPAVFQHIAPALTAYAEALICCPWLERYPLALVGVVLTQQAGQWYLLDTQQHGLGLQLGDGQGWSLLAVSGGQPLAVFGEWDGQQLQPLSAWQAGKLIWQATVSELFNGGSIAA